MLLKKKLFNVASVKKRFFFAFSTEQFEVESDKKGFQRRNSLKFRMFSI